MVEIYETNILILVNLWLNNNYYKQTKILSVTKFFPWRTKPGLGDCLVVETNVLVGAMMQARDCLDTIAHDFGGGEGLIKGTNDSLF